MAKFRHEVIENQFDSNKKQVITCFLLESRFLRFFFLYRKFSLFLAKNFSLLEIKYSNVEAGFVRVAGIFSQVRVRRGFVSTRLNIVALL